MVSMMDKQQIPAGYKQTEVGVIPEDWSIISIDEAIDRKIILDQMDGNHGELYPKSHEFSDFGIPYVGATDFNNGRVNFNNCKYLPEKRAKLFRKGIAKQGDVLFAHNATVGPVALLETNYEFIILSTTATYYRCNLDLINNKYLASYFSSGLFVNQYSAVMSQSTRNQVPILTQRKFKLILPNLKEQTAIANALSDVDALIAALEKLIDKKTAIKTATMQQLLTGKKRLPPFDQLDVGFKQTELGEIPEDWEASEFGDYLDSCSSGATPYRGRPEYYKGSVRWISSGELNYNVIYDTIEKISDEAVKKTNLKIHPKGTFLIAITGLEAAGTRGSCGFIGKPSATNQSCMALYTNNKLNTNYLFHYYVYKGNELAFKYCQGTKQQSYTAKLVRLLPIVLPKSIEEQTAIANVLSNMDTELNALQQRLAKTQHIKQGMMQELLTGKTRLI